MTLYDIQNEIQAKVDDYLKTYFLTFSELTTQIYNKKLADNVPPKSAFTIALDHILPILVQRAHELRSNWSGKGSEVRNMLEGKQREAVIQVMKEIYRRREPHVECLTKRNWDQGLVEETFFNLFTSY